MIKHKLFIYVLPAIYSLFLADTLNYFYDCPCYNYYKLTRKNNYRHNCKAQFVTPPLEPDKIQLL